MIKYDVNGIALNDAAGRWWVTAEGSSHSPAATFRSIDAKVPGITGLVPSPKPELREEATMNLRLMVASRDPAIREARFEAVKSLFGLGRLFILGRAIGSARRTATVKVKSISEPDLHARTGSLVAVFQLTILDGAFHSPPTDSAAFPLTAAGAIVDVTAAAGTTTVDDWWIRVNGPAASVLVRPVVDGVIDSSRLIEWAGTKTSTQRLFLRQNIGWLASSDAWTEPSAPNASAQVSSGAAGSLMLVPQPTASDPMVRRARIHIQGSGVDGTSMLTVRAGAAWL